MSHVTTLGALRDAGQLEFGDGYRTRRDQLAPEGYRILRAADVNQGRIDLQGEDFVSPEFSKAIGAKWARSGDVILTTKGTVGRVAQVQSLGEPVVYSPQLCYFRTANGAPLCATFLKAWFSGPEFVSQASFLMHNTDMAPYISLRDVAGLWITLPPVAQQEAIAEVLGALDDKIAANSGVVRGCDELALARFAAMTRHTAVPLSKTARFVNGRNFTKDASGTGRVVIRIAELNSGIGGSTVRNEVSAVPDNVANPGDILFAWSGSLTVRRWAMDEGLVNQHIFKVIPQGQYPKWLVHQLLLDKLADYRSIAADKATTMGHIQRRHLDQLVHVPGLREIERWSPLMDGLWERALAAELESRTLAALRDTLLPQLMSGKLRVRDAERQVEEAL